MEKVTLIDTEVSNISSVANAFKRIGCDVTITNSPKKVNNASFLVLPGVGAFEHGMNALRKFQLVDSIKRRVEEDKVPIIGICLGMQLLAENSDEHGSHAGLGIISGNVVTLETTNSDYRVPNIGWNDVIADKKCVMFNETKLRQNFYHVHSFHMQCTNPDDIAAHIAFSGNKVTVAIERENIFGMQFHPEKSQDDGLNILSKVVESF